MTEEQKNQEQAAAKAPQDDAAGQAELSEETLGQVAGGVKRRGGGDGSLDDLEVSR